ncbi:MAG: histidine kinase dimerization/phosphoacceptor domain-containing protein [Vicinamibacterales bacterium]
MRVRGTVTYINEREPAGIIVHDGTAGVFVRYGRTFLTAQTIRLRPGDVIDVEGVTTAEGFAPDVRSQQVRRIGRAALPRPKQVSYAALSGGGFDCEYIEVVGVGRRAWVSESGKTLFVDIAVEGGTIRAWFWDFAPDDLQRFIDARIRLRGNAGTLYTPARQVRGISLFAGRTADAVLDTSAPDPWALPIRAIGSIYTHQAMDHINRRVRLRGTVTATREGQPVLVEDITMHSRSRDVRHKIYIRDETSAALIETEESIALKPGDIIEAAGFPMVSSTTPRLQNAAIRRVGAGVPPTPAGLTSELSALADRDAELVQLEASLLADVATPAGRSFVLKRGDTVFEASLDPAVTAAGPAIPGGSRVSVRGVYEYDAGPPPAFRLLLRSDADIVLLATAPWWTPRHSLVLVIVMGVSGLLGLAWARTVAHRNAIVNERYCAIIAERSRLATELHDTLEQGLAGIQLQLGAVSRSLDSSPPTARRALSTATEMLRYSLNEARRSVMDLRHGALETRDLAGALTDVAERMTSGTPLTARVRTSYLALAVLAPGVTLDTNGTPARLGGGGDPNIMMDGVSAMDTGSNRPLLQMNVESIAEVKVLTSGYQAEYGRASGVQVTAITKSGTNRFRGSVYDVERDSDWYSNTKTNLLNGDPKAVLRERDLGYSIGGPIGRPGGRNKLFFFYSQEFAPRTAGNNVIRFRMPTALERAGDFSQSTDNNGVLYPYIKDPLIAGACTAADQAACFRDGGVVGRIPGNRLYGPGMNILNLYPLPNIANVPAAQNYNFEITRPEESALSWQPAIRIDYQPTPKLRASVKYSAWWQRDQVFNGTIPGFNDTKMQHAPVVSYTASANYMLTPTMFLEATYGHSQNELAGCAQAQSSTGAIFCNNAGGTAGVQITPYASLAGANLQALPFLFPDATVLDPDYYAVQALNEIQPAFWDGTRISKVPVFQWGGRVANAPPTLGFPGWLNVNSTHDLAISLTKVLGRHTMKTGFYTTHSYKAEQVGAQAFGTINFQQDAVGTNPFDTSFGFANAAIGTFSSFQQAERYVETASVYRNVDFYAQDNWKVISRLTLDYGVRMVHQGAQYDQLGQASNFLPERWALSSAPTLYGAACLGASPCTGNNRVAVNPLTGQNLGSGSSVAIGTLVPSTGNRLNGLFLPGGDIPKATYDSPFLGVAPRFGAAYDLTGRQTLVLRGGAGIFFDRPFTTALSGGVNNPPTSATVTAQFSQLQTLGGSGLRIAGAPGLTGVNFDSKLPASAQWNVGLQAALRWATTVDVSYVGSHGYDLLQQVNINAIDFGATFLPQNQDPTLATSTTPGATAVTNNLLRAYRGYGNINLFWNRGWRTYHSMQLSFQRRFQNGLSFGVNDTVGLSDRQQAGLRLQHAADGSYSIRADQDEADRLLGNNNPVRNVMRANFIWDTPDVTSSQSGWKAIGYLVNDWQLSGIWSGARRGANVGAGNSNVPSGAYTVGFSYANGGGNQNLTGSPDYGSRILVVGDPGHGCNGDDPLRQFNTSAFRGPAVGSVGLESGNDYLKACFISALDLAIRRNIRLGGSRTIEMRVDMFNTFNQAGITGRNTTMNLNSPGDPTTITNLPFNPDGTVIDARSRPRGAGFGVATGYQDPRTVQLQFRFAF